GDDHAAIEAEALFRDDADEADAGVEDDGFSWFKDEAHIAQVIAVEQVLEVAREVAHVFDGKCGLVADGSRKTSTERECLDANPAVLAAPDEFYKGACRRLIHARVIDVAAHKVKALEVHVWAFP